MSSVTTRVSELFKTDKRPEIPRGYGVNSLVDPAEAVMIRDMFKECKLEELVSLELGIDLHLIDKVLSGEIWPYAGGRLKIQGSGPNPRNVFTNNLRKYCYGVIGIARAYLTDEEFSVFCDMNGLAPWRANQIVKQLDIKDGRKLYPAYRKTLSLSFNYESPDRVADTGESKYKRG